MSGCSAWLDHLEQVLSSVFCIVQRGSNSLLGLVVLGQRKPGRSGSSSVRAL